MQNNHRRSGSYGHFPPQSPGDPGYYPQRPNSYFGGSSQNSGVPLRQASGSQAGYRDSHEMAGGPGGRGGGPGAGRPSAGRNKHAFGDDGSDSEASDDGQGFNVYNDFNNNGARYSNVISSADTYREDPFASSPSQVGKGAYSATPTTPDANEPLKRDLVAMPHLGQEWDNQEARKDKRWEGKAGAKKLAWAQKKGAAGEGFHAWMRGEKKLGGWFGWRQGVFLVFFLLIAFGVTLYFVIPRAPSLAYNHEQLLVGNNSTMAFSRTPTNFSFDATVNLALDGRNSYIPVQARNIKVTVYDLGATDGTVKIGTGKQGSLTTSPSGYKAFSVPVHFTYATSNGTSDPMWSTYYSACGHMWPGNSTRPTLMWNLRVEFSVIGLIGTKGGQTSINGIDCPIELPANGA